MHAGKSWQSLSARAYTLTTATTANSAEIAFSSQADFTEISLNIRDTFNSKEVNTARVMNVLDTPQLQITVSRQVAIELLSGLSAANPGSAAPPTESAAEILGIPDGSCNADDPVTIFANAVDAITCNKARLWVQESSHRPVVLQLASNNQCVIRGIQVE